MPFALVIIGLIMIVSGARNTHAALGRELQNDFTGPGNFITWVVAFGVVGSLGYIQALEKPSRYFMALILISMMLSNEGFFAKFGAALASGPVSPVQDAPAASAETGSSQPTINKPWSDLTPAEKSAPALGGDGSANAKANTYLNYLFKGLFGNL